MASTEVVKVTKTTETARINTMIDETIRQGKAFGDRLHLTATACLQHAEKYGDYTLMVRFLQEVKDKLPGYDMAGWKKWVEDHSPIRLDMKKDENGKPTKTIEGKLLREGDEGFKPFATIEAAVKPAMSDSSVIARGNRALEPLNIAWLKGQIGRFSSQVEKARKEGNRAFATKDPSTGKEVPMTPAQIKQFDAYLAAVVNTPIPALEGETPVSPADSKGQSRRAVRAAKRQVASEPAIEEAAA